ncbi:type IV toxin-antitoxin system AbiEi family antitoxin domain-containing protein [Naasia lichenicola]|uniref:AbiEi antitoxin N-terminal domain-containing protein n=1 Tax=Naasia lichenicola TaxID=2565933 RepID=A0A4V3WT05_9MICO|nr:type IV toxin-antitoxin system AbiEi family antitoxin domain-containing protein [Naasia lichenicola]THG30167.1 hypothetical protein E6C64_16195 [Naasia lichenicola]
MLAPLDIASLQLDGVMLTRDLEALGIHPTRVAELVRSGSLIRIRRGAYVRASAWASASRDEQHRMLVRATDGLHSRRLVFSHYAAAALHGLPLIGAWPQRVHVLDSAAAGGSSMPGLFVHRTTAPRSVETIGSLTVTSIDRTLVDIGITASHLVAVTMMDFALHSGLATTETLLEELAYVSPGRGGKKAASAIYFADGRSESVGESLSRVRMQQLGFEPPDLQVRFRDQQGLNAVVDFAWDAGRVVGEFDGREKYLNPKLTRGRSADLVVLDEKAREDRIRTQVDRFIRWGWEMAFDASRFGPFLERNGVPRRRTATFPTVGQVSKGGRR